MMKAIEVERFLQDLRRRGLAPASIVAYRSHLNPLLKFLDGKDPVRASRADLNAFVDHLYSRNARWNSGSKYHSPQPGGLSMATIGDYVAASKRFYAWLVQQGLREDNPAAHLVVPERSKEKPKAIRPDDFASMLAATSRSTMPKRDRAILLLLYNAGPRLGALAGLRLQDLELERGRATVRGKGRKSRYIYFNHQVTAMALREWLAVRPDTDSDALFTTADGRPLTKSGIVSLTRRLAKRAGVKRQFRPHSFRHRFALEQLDTGNDLATVARLMGHASSETTLLAYARWADTEIERKAREHDPVLRLLRLGGFPTDVGAIPSIRSDAETAGLGSDT